MKSLSFSSRRGHNRKQTSLLRGKTCKQIMLPILATLFAAYSAAAISHDEVIPVLDLDTTDKVVVVDLLFTGMMNTEPGSVTVVYGKSRGLAGDPPLLVVLLRDLDGNVRKEFNAWHPLLGEEFGENGNRNLILSEGLGSFTFPFSPDLVTMNVEDGDTRELISTVDLVSGMHDFCRSNSDDTECANVVNRPPVCDANGPYVAECTGATTSVTLDGSGSSDPDDDPLSYLWSGVFGSATGASPTLAFSGLDNFTVDLDVSDDFGGTSMCATTVRVEDTTPPTIDAMSVTPTVLWPPNHKMVPVGVSMTATDTCDPNPTCMIVSISSNEPVNGKGDGNTSPDWENTGDFTANLRAERAGKASGRVYTITGQCTDVSGNSADQSVDVTVLHDKKKP
jgi:hypothetical protein